MNPLEKNHRHNTRRQFFGRAATGIGAAALGSLLARESAFASSNDGLVPASGLHFRAKAKRVIYLMMSGGPSHIDMFDYKPGLEERRGEQLPDSVRQGQRLTTMTSSQKQLPVLPPHKPFRTYGNSEMMLSTMTPTPARSRTTFAWSSR